MLKRKVYQELLKWKENTEGKALCIIGARQIGKTTLIREFGKNEYRGADSAVCKCRRDPACPQIR